MKTCGLISLILCWSLLGWGGSSSAILQRGASVYINYCVGCHALHYLTYQRMAYDLNLIDKNKKIDKNLLYGNLIFSESLLNHTIETSLSSQDALNWFGRVPPDLSLITRQKPTRWLKQYLRGFYRDSKRPFGVNNHMLFNTNMPNIFMRLPDTRYQIKAFDQAQKQHTNQMIEDLVAFLVYVGDPFYTKRHYLGYWVMGWLTGMWILALGLMRSYWPKSLQKHV